MMVSCLSYLRPAIIVTEKFGSGNEAHILTVRPRKKGLAPMGFDGSFNTRYGDGVAYPFAPHFTFFSADM